MQRLVAIGCAALLATAMAVSDAPQATAKEYTLQGSLTPPYGDSQWSDLKIAVVQAKGCSGKRGVGCKVTDRKVSVADGKFSFKYSDSSKNRNGSWDIVNVSLEHKGKPVKMLINGNKVADVVSLTGETQLDLQIAPKTAQNKTYKLPKNADPGASVAAPKLKVDDWEASYQWLRDGQPIPDATAASYKLAAVDANTTLTLQVSLANAKRNPVVFNIGATAVSGNIPPELVPPPEPSPAQPEPTQVQPDATTSAIPSPTEAPPPAKAPPSLGEAIVWFLGAIPRLLFS